MVMCVGVGRYRKKTKACYCGFLRFCLYFILGLVLVKASPFAVCIIVLYVHACMLYYCNMSLVRLR